MGYWLHCVDMHLSTLQANVNRSVWGSLSFAKWGVVREKGRIQYFIFSLSEVQLEKIGVQGMLVLSLIDIPSLAAIADKPRKLRTIPACYIGN